LVGKLEKQVKELKNKDKFATAEVSPKRESSDAHNEEVENLNNQIETMQAEIDDHKA
jgi:FtsZ-binding cell division protein ZapB